MSAVAVLDCTTAVTPIPERTAVNRLLTLREMSCQIGAEHPQDAGTHQVRAPDEQGHGS